MPKIVDRNQRRREIAAAACIAISKHGIQKVKLTDIGRQAGCTTGAITHYFADKNDVLAAAWDHVYADLLKQVNRVSAQNPYSLVDVLSQSLPISPMSCVLLKVWLALTTRSVNEPSLAKKQIDTSRRWNRQIQNEVRKAQRLGLIDAHIDPAVESQMISVVINGICLRALVDSRHWPATRQIDYLRRHIDRLKPRPNQGSAKG